MAGFDIQLYLRLVELDRKVDIGAAPTLELLQVLVKHQVTHVPYQNLDLLETRAEVDLSPSTLLQRVLVDNRGGVCFELCELMLAVLLAFKFDARRVTTRCFGESKPSGPVDNHPIIVVHLNGKMYHVDTAFGYNSFREALEFNYEQTQERTCFPYEKYRLQCLEDHFEVEMWIKNDWAAIYRFERPLRYVDDALLMEKYREFMYFSGHLPVRDSFFKAGIATDTGRIGFTCNFDSKNHKGCPPYKCFVDNSGTMKSDVVNYVTFRQGLKTIMNIHMNDVHFEQTD